MFDIKLKIMLCSQDEEFCRLLAPVKPEEGFDFAITAVRKNFEFAAEDTPDLIICDLPPDEIPTDIPRRRTDGAPQLILVERGPLTQERLEEFLDIWELPLSRPAYRLHRAVRNVMEIRRHAILRRTMHLAADSVPDLFWMKDKEGRHFNVNNAFCELVGKTKEQCKGRGHYYIWDIEPDEYAKGEFVCLESEDTVVKARKTCLFDEKIIGPDGSKLQFQTYKTPIFDVDESIIGTFGIAKDVTNWKNQISELNLIIDSLDNAALLVDANNNIVVVNRAASMLFGQRKSEIVGTNYNDWRAETLHYGRKLMPGERVQIEYERNGNIKNLEIIEEPIFDVFNQRLGVFVRLIDITEHVDHIKLLTNYKMELEADVRLKTKTIKEMQRKFLISFSDLINSRDAAATNHIKNTCSCVEILLDELRKDGKLPQLEDEEYCEDVLRAVPLHDIGKINLPDTILHKQERYNDEELRVKRTHTEMGGRILAQTLSHIETFKYFRIAWNMAVSHHESWDGTGYPKGLAGEAIPLEARIMGLANAFDRLLADRPYRKGYGMDEAFKRVREAAGMQLDPYLVEIFLKARPLIEKKLNEGMTGN